MMDVHEYRKSYEYTLNHGIGRLKRIIETEPSLPAENTLLATIELLENQHRIIKALECRVVEAEMNPKLRHPGSAEYVLDKMDDVRREELLKCVKGICTTFLVWPMDIYGLMDVAAKLKDANISHVEFAAALSIHGMSFADEFDEIEYSDAFDETCGEENQ